MISSNSGVLINSDVTSRLVEQGLTPRQAEIFLCFFEYTRINGYQPTFREIAGWNGSDSPNFITCHLKALRRKGWIGLGNGSSRAMKILRTLSGKPFIGFAVQEEKS